MDAFQIIKDFLVEGSQFFIKPNCPVFISFLALLSVWTSAAILALINLFLATIQVSFYRLSVCKDEFLSVRTDQISVLVGFEIHCPEWIVVVLFVCRLFLIHRELHVFFHSVLLAEQIIVV